MHRRRPFPSTIPPKQPDFRRMRTHPRAVPSYLQAPAPARRRGFPQARRVSPRFPRASVRSQAPSPTGGASAPNLRPRCSAARSRRRFCGSANTGRHSGRALPRAAPPARSAMPDFFPFRALAQALAAAQASVQGPVQASAWARAWASAAVPSERSRRKSGRICCSAAAHCRNKDSSYVSLLLFFSSSVV